MASALEGIRVIDVSQVAAAPMCARHLADFGADVLHIENPVTGDSLRVFQDAQTRGMACAPSSINYGWETFNRNKRSVTLDLAHATGRKIIYRLLDQADVFVTNLRRFEMDRFGLDYASLSQVNPRLIHASLNGFGKKGPDSDAPAYDTTAYWARSGIPFAFSLPGVPIMGYRPAFGDNVAGLALAYGIMTALFVRERTGKGQEVNTSLMQSGLYQLSYDIAGALNTGLDFADWREDPPAELVEQAQLANMQIGAFYASRANNPLAAAYTTKDLRAIVLVALQPDRYWKKFCLAIGREDLANDPRFETVEGRTEHNMAIRMAIGQTFATKTLAEWIPLLEGIPFGPMQNMKEVINDPQARANGFFVTYDHPAYGKFETLASPVDLSETPAQVRMPAPEFGQHTEEVLVEAGFSWEEIIQFKEEGVVF